MKRVNNYRAWFQVVDSRLDGSEGPLSASDNDEITSVTLVSARSPFTGSANVLVGERGSVSQALRETGCNIGTAFHVATDARHRATIVAYDPRESEKHDNGEKLKVRKICTVHIRVNSIADKLFLNLK